MGYQSLAQWLARYETVGLAGQADQSRRPHTSLPRFDGELAALVTATRVAHPNWGTRKLLAYLHRRHHRPAWPAVGTVGALLRHEGLVAPRRRKRPLGRPGRPTTPRDAPNAVWTADRR